MECGECDADGEGECPEDVWDIMKLNMAMLDIWRVL